MCRQFYETNKFYFVKQFVENKNQIKKSLKDSLLVGFLLLMYIVNIAKN